MIKSYVELCLMSTDTCVSLGGFRVCDQKCSNVPVKVVCCFWTCLSPQVEKCMVWKGIEQFVGYTILKWYCFVLLTAWDSGRTVWSSWRSLCTKERRKVCLVTRCQLASSKSCVKKICCSCATAMSMTPTTSHLSEISAAEIWWEP